MVYLWICNLDVPITNLFLKTHTWKKKFVDDVDDMEDAVFSDSQTSVTTDNKKETSKFKKKWFKAPP